MAKVHSTTAVIPIESSNGEINEESNCSDIDLKKETLTVERERLFAEFKAENRMKRFKDIVTNSTAENFSITPILFIFIYLIVSLVVILPVACIPFHNVIREPQYWYEYHLLIIHLPLVLGTGFLLNSSNWTNITYLRKWKHLLYICLSGYSTKVICYGSAYLIWTYLFELSWPVPFGVYLNWWIIIAIMIATLYLQFPFDWRTEEEFQERLKNLVIALLWEINGLSCIHLIFGIMFSEFRNNYQWVVAIALFPIREACKILLDRFGKKASNGDPTAAEITSTFTFATLHAIFECYIVGDLATTTSTFIIISQEFIPMIYLVLQIIWIKKKRPDDVREQIKLLQNLVVKEMVGFLVPIIFLSCFTVAYFGPNSELLGNVRNNYWNYRAVEDYGSYVGKVLMIFFIDVVGMILSSVVLWKTCNINLYRIYSALHEEFGRLFLINIVRWIMSVI